MNTHTSRILLASLAFSCTFAACSRGPAKTVGGNAQIQGHYDAKTGKLTSITYDSNKNGKIDTWSYMDGARIVRIEIDKDEDGRIDRWEYYGADQKLEKVGWSRANNGRPDAWGYPDASGRMAKVELAALPAAPATATTPDAGLRTPDAGLRTPDSGPGTPDAGLRTPDSGLRIVRTEYYENGVLVRAEEDTNGDGRIDKWETWSGGKLAMLAFDRTGRGTPDRRLVYGPDGSVKIEIDSTGTGQFKPAPRGK